MTVSVLIQKSFFNAKIGRYLLGFETGRSSTSSDSWLNPLKISSVRGPFVHESQLSCGSSLPARIPDRREARGTVVQYEAGLEPAGAWRGSRAGLAGTFPWNDSAVRGPPRPKSVSCSRREKVSQPSFEPTIS
jgi:hypothetical protein